MKNQIEILTYLYYIVGSKKHKLNEKAVASSSMKQFLTKKDNPSEIHPSIKAEVKMALMIVHHNTFFNLSDHLTQIIKSEFHGSCAAEQFSCGRTKTAAIVNCIGAELKAQLVNDMKNFPFSIMIDGSNDTGIAKMYPITVRIYDVEFSRVMTKFFDINLIEGRTSGTAATIFENVDAVFNNHAIQWSSVTGLGVDNTNVNIGEHDSIKSRVLEKEPGIVVVGCPCHMLHNAAGKGATAYGNITNFDIEDHCVDLFYWFDKSTKRKGALKEYFEFCDTNYEAVIKYVSVRWLCLEHCIARELKKYVALKSYFCSEDEQGNRFQRLYGAFDDPMTEIHLLFFQSTIAMFTKFNRFLQREDPLLYLMNTQMEAFMQKLAAKFVKPEKIMAHKQVKGSLKSLDISLDNQKQDESLSIGMVTKAKLRKLLNDGDIDLQSVDKFYDGVRAFYKISFAYCTKWLPLDNTLLKNCVFVDFEQRNVCSMENVEGVLTALWHIHTDLINNSRAMDTLEEEFLVYQTMARTDIPSHIWEESAVIEKDVDGGEALTYHRMDMIWGYLRDKLPNLSKVALSVLTIPHSNAAEERVFSLVRKNKTDFRANLDLETSLSSIMTIKMNRPASLQPCHKFKPTKELLKKCKAACREYNRLHTGQGNAGNS